MGNLIRNILNQLAIGGAEVVTTEALSSSLGLPPGTGLAITTAKGIVKGVAQTAVLKAYDDICSRQISKLEVSKVNYAFDKAEKVFWEFVEKDGENAGYAFDAGSGEFENAMQVAEGFLLQSMREFEHKKLDVLGCFYGKSLYDGDNQWESIHHTLKMTDRLTYRQIVLIRLICEKFSGIDPSYCITAKDACVETMDLINFGIWATPGAYLSQDNSSPIVLETLAPTEYSFELYKKLMLERIPKDDIEQVKKTLCITKSDVANELLTVADKKQINNSMTWAVEAIEQKADSDSDTY
jgi:hypothetical protein